MEFRKFIKHSRTYVHVIIKLTHLQDSHCYEIFYNSKIQFYN